jgi:hypothetical protein
MKKFIIVDTFNGEGYSNSKAEVKEFESLDEAKVYAYNLANEFCGDNGSLVLTERQVIYGINPNDEGDFDDYGAVHFEELPVGIVSVTINPDVNEYSLHNAESDAWVIDYIKSESLWFRLEDCHHLDDEVVIYQKL